MKTLNTYRLLDLTCSTSLPTNTVRGQEINTWKMRITIAHFLAKQHPKDLVGKFDNFLVALSRFAYIATFLFVAELEMFIAC